MPSTIQTVTGAIPVAGQSKIQLHEHVLCAYPGWNFDNRYAAFDKKTAVPKAVAKMFLLKGHGVTCVVDPCPTELGRDPEFMAEVSERSGMPIVCSCGFDIETRGYFLAMRKLSSEEIEEMLLQEITDGIDKTGIRPGVIKAGSGNGVISDYERRCLHAAARAAKKMNLPVITHTEFGTMGPDQLQIFKSNGLNPHKCLIGHCCYNTDLEYHKEIADQGGLVGFDRFGTVFTSDETRLETLEKLIQMGYAGSFALSTDSPITYKGKFPFDPGKTGNMRPEYIYDTIIPKLRERGVSEADITQITSVNTCRFFWEDH